jgi:hypothetical protein
MGGRGRAGKGPSPPSHVCCVCNLTTRLLTHPRFSRVGVASAVFFAHLLHDFNPWP